MDAPRPRLRLWILLGVLIAILLALAIPVGIALSNAAGLNRKFTQSVEGATRVRVWAAGIRRNSDGSFCPCAPVPKPERMLYETNDPTQIEQLVSCFAAAPHLGLIPEERIESCSILTIDFLQGDKMLASIHVSGTRLRSTWVSWWEMDITSRSRTRIDGWLKDRGVKDKLDAAARWF